MLLSSLQVIIGPTTNLQSCLHYREKYVLIMALENDIDVFPDVGSIGVAHPNSPFTVTRSRSLCHQFCSFPLPLPPPPLLFNQYWLAFSLHRAVSSLIANSST